MTIKQSDLQFPITIDMVTNKLLNKIENNYYYLKIYFITTQRLGRIISGDIRNNILDTLYYDNNTKN